MTDLSERRIGELTVRIDRLLCVGFADCVAEAPETFELDEGGIAEFRADPGQVSRERLIRACAACPVDALSVLDSDGTPLVS